MPSVDPGSCLQCRHDGVAHSTFVWGVIMRTESADLVAGLEVGESAYPAGIGQINNTINSNIKTNQRMAHSFPSIDGKNADIEESRCVATGIAPCRRGAVERRCRTRAYKRGGFRRRTGG